MYMNLKLDEHWSNSNTSTLGPSKISVGPTPTIPFLPLKVSKKLPLYNHMI